MRKQKFSRRQVGKLAMGAAMAGLTANVLMPHKARARDAKLVFWLQPNFNKAADDLLVAQTMDYARAQGLSEGDVQIEKVPGGEVATRMAAALEVGAPPDVTRVNNTNMAKWGNDGHLVDLTHLIEEMRSVAGGINESAVPLATINDGVRGVPMGIAANAAHVRIDKFREAGYDALPATWEAFIEAGTKITKPPFYAAGMALGLTPYDSLGDVMAVVSAYGGSMTDAENLPVFESDGTVQAFELINAMYNEHRIIPRGALSWDNSGNNKAFQSGQIAYALNPTSIYSSLVKDNNPILEHTVLDIAPGGPAGRFSTVSTDYYGVFEASPSRDLAIGLVQHFLKPENYSRFITETAGRYLPVYPELLNDPFWDSNPAFAGLKAAARIGQSFFHPGRLTPALSEVVNRGLIMNEVQNMLVKDKEPARAVADAHQAIVETFSRQGEPT